VIGRHHFRPVVIAASYRARLGIVTGKVSVRIFDLLTVQRNVGAASAMSVVLAVLLSLMLAFYTFMMRRRGERI